MAIKICIVASHAPSILNFRKELILALKKKAEIVVLVPYFDEVTKQAIRDLGVDCYDVVLNSKGLSPIQDFKTVYQLYQLFKKINPSMVLSYTIKPVIWGSIAAKLAGVRCIYSMITGLGYAFTDVITLKRKYLHSLIVILYRLAIRVNKVVFFQNPDDLMVFKQKKILNHVKSVVLNGSGVNLDYFYFATPFCSPIRFLIITRLLKDKGIYEFFEAAKIIKASYAHVEFHVVGYIDENPSAITSEELENWCESGFIIYHGRQDDVRPIIEQSSVYVLPSYREGTPRSVLEAMAMGRPIITTDAPGCRETVIDAENGFLVPVKSSDGLVKAMEKFINDPSLIRIMGKKSRALVEKKYNVHEVNQVILQHMNLSS